MNTAIMTFFLKFFSFLTGFFFLVMVAYSLYLLYVNIHRVKNFFTPRRTFLIICVIIISLAVSYFLFYNKVFFFPIEENSHYLFWGLNFPNTTLEYTGPARIYNAVGYMYLFPLSISLFGIPDALRLLPLTAILSYLIYVGLLFLIFLIFQNKKLKKRYLLLILLFFALNRWLLIFLYEFKFSHLFALFSSVFGIFILQSLKDNKHSVFPHILFLFNFALGTLTRKDYFIINLIFLLSYLSLLKHLVFSKNLSNFRKGMVLSALTLTLIVVLVYGTHLMLQSNQYTNTFSLTSFRQSFSRTFFFWQEGYGHFLFPLTYCALFIGLFFNNLRKHSIWFLFIFTLFMSSVRIWDPRSFELYSLLYFVLFFLHLSRFKKGFLWKFFVVSLVFLLLVELLLIPLLFKFISERQLKENCLREFYKNLLGKPALVFSPYYKGYFSLIFYNTSVSVIHFPSEKYESLPFENSYGEYKPKILFMLDYQLEKLPPSLSDSKIMPFCNLNNMFFMYLG